jgi:hypothetical protein
MWYIPAIEYNLALNMPDICYLPCIYVYIEIRQPQKDKYCMILLILVPRVVKVIETESRMVVFRDWV